MSERVVLHTTYKGSSDEDREWLAIDDKMDQRRLMTDDRRPEDPKTRRPEDPKTRRLEDSKTRRLEDSKTRRLEDPKT